MPSLHAKLGPSSSARFLNCLGSVYLSDGVEEERISEWAAEGTVAHHVRECSLLLGLDLEFFLGDEISADGMNFTVDEDMIEHLRPGIEWVQSRPGDVFNEFRVSLDRWLPGQFGTLDVGILEPELIVINDLKYGAGVPVAAEENEQLMTYALGFWDNIARHRTKVEDFLIVIDQPRAVGGGGEWEVDLIRLLEHGERLQAAFDEIYPEELREDPDDYSTWGLADNLPLKAGAKQCRFCKAKNICPEYARWSLDQMSLKFDDLDGDELTPQSADEMTPNRRAMVASNLDVIEAWAKSIHAAVLSDALAGKPTPGLKVTYGRRGRKTWIDQDEAFRFVTEFVPEEKALGEPQLLSPTQVEKIVPKAKKADFKARWESHYSQSDGKPVLVPEDDDKPKVSHADKFDD